MNGKLYILILTFFCYLNTIAQQQNFFQETDALLKKCVINGLVDYKSINKDELNKLVTFIETPTIEDNTEEAFYINAYNLLVIKSIIDNLPIQSPMDVNGFFDTKKHKINNENLSLNDIENKKLRAIYNDPRLHFVLVCGAKGCPPITNFAYTPEILDQQLTSQTKKAINNIDFINELSSTNELAVSEIFKWYKEDFNGSNDGIIEFIKKYNTQPLENISSLTFYPYDWAVNDVPNTESLRLESNNQLYNAGTLLKKGQIDITLFNSIYTETKQNWLGTDYDGYRTTFASSLFQFTLGTSKSARFNIGIDVSLKASSTIRDNSFETIKEPFQFTNDISHRSGIGSIGPRIRLAPFKALPNFSLQSTYLISPAKSPEGDVNLYWIEWDRHIWWTQFFYSKTFSQDKLQLFTELDFLFRFKKHATQISMLDLPLNIFLSYFHNKLFTFYLMGQHVPRFVPNAGSNSDWPISANYSQLGGGMKYQITKKMNLELLYANFFRGQNTGLGSSINVGLKYIR